MHGLTTIHKLNEQKAGAFAIVNDRLERTTIRVSYLEGIIAYALRVMDRDPAEAKRALTEADGTSALARAASMATDIVIEDEVAGPRPLSELLGPGE